MIIVQEISIELLLLKNNILIVFGILVLKYAILFHPIDIETAVPLFFFFFQLINDHNFPALRLG